MKTQPHIILKLIVVCLLLMSCNDKKTIHPIKLNAKTSEKFDLKRFNDNKKDSVYEYFLSDTIIKLYEKNEHYKKELIVDNSFVQTFIYDKTTKSLINKSSVFLAMPIGIWTNYDENGTLTYWKNYDEGFDFTVNDLIVMLKKDLQIDLINDERYGFGISRHFDKKFYFISSYYYLIQMSTELGTRTIKIDGETGKILTDESSFYEE
jgi:hypothetical protein